MLHIIKLFLFVSLLLQKLELSEGDIPGLEPRPRENDGQCSSHYNCVSSGRVDEGVFEQMFNPYPENVTMFNWNDLRTKEIPDTFATLFTNLEYLKLVNLGDLTRVPSGLSNLSCLLELDVSECKQLTCLPEDLVDCTRLRNLMFSFTNISDLPEAIGSCKTLTNICGSHSLITRLPDSFTLLANLEVLQLSGCPLGRLPAGFRRLRKLRKLELAGK